MSPGCLASEWCETKGWLLMVFLVYAFMFTVRLHFTYAMVELMANPLIQKPSDRKPCEDSDGVLLSAEARTTDGNGTTRPLGVDTMLEWTPQQQSIVAGAYFVGTLLSAFPGGVYANRGHERTLILACMSVTAFTLILMPVATTRYDSWIAVMLLRFVQGCAFGPTGSCGGSLAGKIVPKELRVTHSTFMFSGTVFGGFLGHMYSGTILPRVSHDGSYLVLSAMGFIWVAVWTIMVHVTPYDINGMGSSHSMKISSTPWSMLFGSMPFVSLLLASFGFGYLYSFIATGIPIYRLTVLGGNIIKNGVLVSIPWMGCWFTSIFSGVAAAQLKNHVRKNTVIKIYASMALIVSPLMLLGVVLAKCDKTWARICMNTSVVLFGFERSSIRINSLDLCAKYAGSLIALCDVFNSIGNIMNLVIVRVMFNGTVNWNISFGVSIILPITCSILFILFASSQNQCWDQRFVRPLT